MSAAANLVEVAALVGDTARASMLAVLMEGQALTGSELAEVARISRPTASEHLGKLVAARIVVMRREGRHCYYRIGSPLVAAMLESIGSVAAHVAPPRFVPRSARDDGTRLVRTCYDHLAGRVAVAIADALVARDAIVLSEDGGEVTATGLRLLAGFGLDLGTGQGPRGRVFCRPCLDWTERRVHLAGRLGTALACRCFELDWLRRGAVRRAVTVTPMGRSGLKEVFGIDLGEVAASPKERRAGAYSAA